MLSGKRHTFIATPCMSSGMYVERNVPPHGKNIPTATSKTQKAEKTAMKSLVKTGMMMATAPSAKTRMASCSTGTELDISKSRPPMVMHAMRQLNTRPVGSGSDDSESSVGTHMKTNVYIVPSNKLVDAATRPIRQLVTISQIDSFMPTSSFLSPS